MSILGRLFRVSAEHGLSTTEDAAVDGFVDPAATAGRKQAPSAPANSSELVAKTGTLDTLRLSNEPGAPVANAQAPESESAEVLLARARAFYQRGRYREALESGRRAAAAGATDLELFLCLGWSGLNMGAPAEAEGWMRKGTVVAPGDWTPHAGLAAALHAQCRYGEAASSYERALALNPSSADCAISLARCRIKEGDHAGAEAEFRRAIALQPEKARARIDLGVLLASLDRYGEALEMLERAVAVAATDEQGADAFVDLAINLRENGRTDEALVEYERNLPHQAHVYGHFAYGVALLTAGRLREGWPLYEFRWLTDRFLAMRANFPPGPVWSGQDLRGKTLLLRSEQGLGDTMQFVRYAPLVKALGGTVHLKVHSGLESVVRGLAGVDRIFDRDELPTEFDYYIHLASLPYVLGTDIDSIPAQVPYLHVPADRLQKWRSKFAETTGRRIGLVWAGNPEHQVDRHRSIPLQTLLPLFQIEDAHYYSLQKGPAADQLKAFPSMENLTDLAPELVDFGDTAAVISCLDLVLCVDTAVAHLAGALGKPVWLMLPTPADWRWLERREDSPWYPTMRLFRQSERGRWVDVVERVRTALEGPLGTQTRHEAPPVLEPKASDSSRPGLIGASKPSRSGPGLCAVAETRYGILQYLPEDTDAANSIAWYGEYLQSQLDVILHLIVPGSVVLEIAAGVGIHSLALARSVGNEGHVYLYESNPTNRRILLQNLGANRLSNFTILKQSFRGSPRSPSLKPEAVSAQERAAARAPHPGGATIDEMHFERLSWIKINEGEDAAAALAGATETLWRLRPLLLVSAPSDVKLRETADVIKEISYRCWHVERALFHPQNFGKRNDDIFGGKRSSALLAIPEEIDIDIALDNCKELT
jgi:tetratricopeptide (TPR) repeat protein